MDVKHSNETICDGEQCEICHDKIVKLFRNMKNYLKRFVETDNLVCFFLFSFERSCANSNVRTIVRFGLF